MKFGAVKNMDIPVSLILSVVLFNDALDTAMVQNVAVMLVQTPNHSV
jgi:hypothetical protein